MKGISGALLSAEVIARQALEADSRQLARATTALRQVIADAETALGPASSARHVYDRLAAPLFEALGLTLEIARDAGDVLAGTAVAPHGRAVSIVITPWGWDVAARWREAVVFGAGRRWCLALNGSAVRIFDTARTYSRRACQFDLASVVQDDRALAGLAALLDGSRLPASLDKAVAATDAHRFAVSTSLQDGVDAALLQLVDGLARPRRRRRPDLDLAFADALTVIYRILFLLFAEARGLVPRWHPVYRDGYTIEALQARIETERRPPGLWEALRAIARLAHRGCRAGTLRVTAFNGRLFAPAGAPLADALALDDGLVRDVLMAITTRPGRERRERISYADLGVEQLGAVYERVLDYAPRTRSDGRAIALVRAGRRKATGTFYTPRTLTEYLVRRTLAPLLRGRTPEEILGVRVLDPAMGSGAFLVAACRYMAAAYEQALVHEGTVAPSDLGPRDRAGFRRAVAQRCLYGVDRNPTAVQLARLSMWLTTLAADRPLTFLDHRLCTGNSLAGASLDDLARQPPGTSAWQAALPLFDAVDLHVGVAACVGPRIALARQPDDTADIVRRKEQTLSSLNGDAGPLARWRSLADAWCAAWFWPDAEPPPARAWTVFADSLLGRPSALPPATASRWRELARASAAREKFFHWTLELPEIFFDADGNPLACGGFDAVVGNPPWATLRGDEGEPADRADAREQAKRLTSFSRGSGCYRLQAGGHANLYLLFLERMLQLLRPGGRLGAILPGGVLSDAGGAPLRRHLLSRCGIDALLVFDNRQRIFPIHRSLRFALLTATTGLQRTTLPCRFDLRCASAVDEVPDEGPVPGAMTLPVDLIARCSGPDLAIPDLRSPLDRDILADIVARVPALGSAADWHLSFGRELNATDDRRHLGRRGLPVLEGKHLIPFRSMTDETSWRIEPGTAARRLGAAGGFTRARLAYREVASATNRLTLIAAVIPAGVVTTHTVFCLKEPLDEAAQQFLCGVLNSFVANYLVRLRVGTHVSAAIMAQLRVPRPARGSRAFTRIAAAARTLGRLEDEAVLAELQADVARLYGLDEARFRHVLSTFPLVPVHRRDRAIDSFLRAPNGI